MEFSFDQLHHPQPKVRTRQSEADKSVLSRHSGFPTLWDTMDNIYGASKGLRRFLGAVGNIVLDDFIQDFKTWYDLRQGRNPTFFTPFMAWRSLFQHLEGPPMDDYHEFRKLYYIEVEAWRACWSQNYVSATGGLGINPVVGVATTATSRASSSGTTTLGPSTSTTTIGVSAGTSSVVVARVQPPFNPILEFFRTLQTNYQGV